MQLEYGLSDGTPKDLVKISFLLGLKTREIEPISNRIHEKIDKNIKARRLLNKCIAGVDYVGSNEGKKVMKKISLMCNLNGIDEAVNSRHYGFETDELQSEDKISSSLGLTRSKVRKSIDKLKKEMAKPGNELPRALFKEYTGQEIVTEKEIQASAAMKTERIIERRELSKQAALEQQKEGDKMTKVEPTYRLLDCTKEQLINALEILTDDELKIFRKRNGEDLDNPESSLTSEEAVKFTNVLRLLKKKIANPTLQRVANGDYPMTEAGIAKKEAREKYIDRLYEVAGIPRPKKEKVEVPKIRDEILAIATAEPEEKIKPVVRPVVIPQETMEINKEVVKELLDSFTPRRAVIMMLKLGYVEGKEYSDEAIAKLFECSVEEVIMDFKEGLKEYKEKQKQVKGPALEKKNNQ